MINKVDYDFVINEILKQGANSAVRKLKEGLDMGSVMKSLDGLPDMFRLAWEMTRPSAAAMHYNVTHRCIEMDEELWASTGFHAARLLVTFGEDGYPMTVLGYVLDKNSKRVTGTPDEGVFQLVQRALDDEIAYRDIRGENGELVSTPDSGYVSTNEALNSKLSKAVRKDIDQQVADFSEQLDDIFGVSPSPGWDPPTPPGGGDSS